MSSDKYTIHFLKDNDSEPWGFGISKKEDGKPFKITEVSKGSFAELVGLRVNDVILDIKEVIINDMSEEEVERFIKEAGNRFDMYIERPGADGNVSYEKSAMSFNVMLGGEKARVVRENEAFMSNVDGKRPELMKDRKKAPPEDPRYEGLDEEDLIKVGVNDVLKPTLRKDWNTPWIRRDGKGLKKIFRNIYGVDPVPAPVKTSYNHFYSEPHSILEPEQHYSPEELERMIREHAANLSGSKDESHMGFTGEKRKTETETENVVQQNGDSHPQEFSQVNEKEVHHQQSINNDSISTAIETDETEDCEPPELEEVVESYTNNSAPTSENNIPPTEPKEEKVKVNGEKSSNGLLDILDIEVIKKNMESFASMKSYEPSADELIQVLKNLENLAAANAPLYMALVQQIEANTKNTSSNIPSAHFDEVAQNIQDANQPLSSEDNYANEEYASTEEFQTSKEMEPHDGEREVMEEYERREIDEEEIVNSQQLVVEREEPSATVEIKEEDEKLDSKVVERHRKIEKEVDQEIEALKVRPRKQQVPVQKVEPRKIKVMAGSQHRASWPCAPNVSGTTLPKMVEVVLGATEEDSLKNRREVAERAGLKHIDIIIGDDSLYPEPYEDSDYPWAGSLKPVSNNASRRDNRDKTGEAIPWAGSLRHVPESQKKKKNKKSDKSSTTAPWMGTLKHVKHENYVTKSFPKPQFKRYPDEDAPNPFQSMSGRDARAAYPLTPAAVIESRSSRAEGLSSKDQEEEVERIRANLRETRTVSSALLKVLMPKLLKEHESKYEPLSFEESQKIMEEILSMQIGLNTDQAVENNDEAEQIIRAITHGEIDKSVYSQMADDLQNAAISRKKETKKKKKAKASSKNSQKNAETNAIKAN